MTILRMQKNDCEKVLKSKNALINVRRIFVISFVNRCNIFGNMQNSIAYFADKVEDHSFVC